MAKPTSRVLSIDELELDFQNPRLLMPNINTEEEAVLELANPDNENDLLSLANSYRVSGYQNFEKLLVCPKDNNKYTVLEGNRRCATAKIMLNPKLAGKFAGSFPACSPELTKELRKIECLVYPSYDDADAQRQIQNKHNGQNSLEWGTFQKRRSLSRFFFDQNLSIKDIVTRTGATESLVQKAIHTDIIVRIVLNNSLMGWSDSEFLKLQQTMATRRSGITTLEDRFINHQETNELALKLIKKQEDLHTEFDVATFLSRLKTIVYYSILLPKIDPANKEKLDSRTGQTFDLRKKWINKYLTEASASGESISLLQLISNPDGIATAKILQCESVTSGSTKISNSDSMKDEVPSGADTIETATDNASAVELNSGIKATDGVDLESTSGSKPKRLPYAQYHFLGDLECRLNDSLLKQLTDEALRMTKYLNLYPVASTMVLRSLLELTLKYYCENTLVSENGESYYERIKKRKAGGNAKRVTLDLLVTECSKEDSGPFSKWDKTLARTLDHALHNTYFFEIIHHGLHGGYVRHTASSAEDLSGLVSGVIREILKGEWLNEQKVDKSA